MDTRPTLALDVCALKLTRKLGTLAPMERLVEMEVMPKTRVSLLTTKSLVKWKSVLPLTGRTSVDPNPLLNVTLDRT